MEYLGGINLFTSHFILGHRMANKNFTNNAIAETEAFHRWEDSEKIYNEQGPYSRYNRTDYVAFFRVIDLEQFKEIVNDLYRIYKKGYPYGKKKDFTNHIFQYTVDDLKYFLDIPKSQINWILHPRDESRFTFYSYCIMMTKHYENFAVDNDVSSDIEYYRQYYMCVLDYLRFFENEAELSVDEAKKTPEIRDGVILFNDPAIIEKLHRELKGYFQNKESDLLKALRGERLGEFLLFPDRANKFVEVFKRLKYNGYLTSAPINIKNWICSNFKYQFERGGVREVRNFNVETVHEILTKEKGEPKKSERICEPDWLPYKSQSMRKRESDRENT